MANWKYRLELKEDWAAAKDGALQPHELAQRIAEKARALSIYEADDELQGIVTDFQYVSEDSKATFDDFDDVMELLYNWADQDVPPYSIWPKNKMCWIATF